MSLLSQLDNYKKELTTQLQHTRMLWNILLLSYVTLISVGLYEYLTIEIGSLPDLSLATHLALLKTALWVNLNSAAYDTVVEFAAKLKNKFTHQRWKYP